MIFKKIAFFFLLCTTTILHAQDLNLLQLEERELANGNGVGIYATNLGHCPLTVIVDFPVLKNMYTDQKLPFHAVVPAQAKQHLVLTVKDKKNPVGNSYEYRYSFTYYLGDVENAEHDDNYVYLLPYANGSSTIIGQGYNGRFSHKNMNCLDFNLSTNSKVIAARGGTVIQMKTNSNTGCKHQKCKGQANYITIYHEDGTFGKYIHLKYRGSLVKVGQKVKAGDHIGWSGNTGWSSGPHLHFEVSKPGKNNMTFTIPTKFKLANGVVGYLEEGETYQAVH